MACIQFIMLPGNFVICFKTAGCFLHFNLEAVLLSFFLALGLWANTSWSACECRQTEPRCMATAVCSTCSPCCPLGTALLLPASLCCHHSCLPRGCTQPEEVGKVAFKSESYFRKQGEIRANAGHGEQDSSRFRILKSFSYKVLL